jgi:hypothetical protein
MEEMMKTGCDDAAKVAFAEILNERSYAYSRRRWVPSKGELEDTE